VRDHGVDAWIERVSGTRVPMLRAADSLAIATHAAEVQRDLQRPSLGEAALEGVEAHAPDQDLPPG
jgi:hypothetical protein